MSTAQKETLSIDGMGCEHCVNAVRSALEAVEGVSVESVEIGSATVTYNPTAVSRARLIEAIQDEGYTVGG